jgi:hypothetical protein
MLAALAEGRAAKSTQQTIATDTGERPSQRYAEFTRNYRQFGLLLKITQNLPDAWGLAFRRRQITALEQQLGTRLAFGIFGWCVAVTLKATACDAAHATSLPTPS